MDAAAALKRANLAAGISVSRAGAIRSIPTQDELNPLSSARLGGSRGRTCQLTTSIDTGQLDQRRLEKLGRRVDQFIDATALLRPRPGLRSRAPAVTSSAKLAGSGIAAVIE